MPTLQFHNVGVAMKMNHEFHAIGLKESSPSVGKIYPFARIAETSWRDA